MAYPQRATRDEILDAAERMIRVGGYNGFSTRDVADAIRIKAASVHYHFPTKADIGVEVTKRYTERFIAALGDPLRFEGHVALAITAYAANFRQALVEERQLCLCAVLGAETGGIPESLQEGARQFFERNLEWLCAALAGEQLTNSDNALAKATLVLSALEGAMILSMSVGDQATFERVVSQLQRL